MNCRQFQNDLYEYLEESLADGAQAAAEQHLEECAACRQRLQDERQVARSLSESFQRATAGLELPAPVRRRVLAAAEEERAARYEREKGSLFWQWLGWPAALAASAAVLVAGWVLLRPLGEPGTGHLQPRLGQGAVSVQLSFVAPVHTFRHEDGFVVDALTCQTTEINERLQPEAAGLH